MWNQPHSKSPNHLRRFRAITNPPMTLKEPLNLNRPKSDYVRLSSPSPPVKSELIEMNQSLVEQKILHDLGMSSLPNWKPTGPTNRYPPRTGPGKAARIKEELERMVAESERTDGEVDSVHLRGEMLEQDRWIARVSAGGS